MDQYLQDLRDASLQEIKYKWDKAKFIKQTTKQPAHFANSYKIADHLPGLPNDA